MTDYSQGEVTAERGRSIESTRTERSDKTPVTPPDPAFVERRAALVERRANYVTDSVANVENAIKLLDAHIDRQLKEIEKHALDSSFTMATRIDVLGNAVAGKLREVDVTLDRNRTRQRWALIALAFLTATQGLELYWDTVHLGAWRHEGRSIQESSAQKLDELLSRVRAHDAVFDRR